MVKNFYTPPFPGAPSLEIDDREDYFSQNELAELGGFIWDNLLSTNTEFAWLGRVIIQNEGKSDYLGYWQIETLEADESSGGIGKLRTVIGINLYNINFLFDTHQKRLHALKETLAHEYGHHWTLSHLLVNGVIQDHSVDRIPGDYYEIRPLSEEQHFPDYRGTEAWERCDKEIIAEDYRCLFAELPNQSNHQMVGLLDGLEHPCERVRDYIRNIPHLS